MTQKKIAIVILAIAALLFACRPTRKSVEPVVIDPVELQTFADKFFAAQMQTLHIPGLSFIFVQGDDVLYASGYGYANLETATPMNADSSVVRIASIDMSHFILAHLGDGCYQGACILQAATLAEMHQRQVATPFVRQQFLAQFLR